MKNNTVNKIISCVVLVVLLCATVVGAYLGIFGRNTQYTTVREDGQDVQRALYRQVAYIPNTINQNWQEAIRPSASLGGGYSYTLAAEGADNAALKAIAKTVKARAELVTGNADAKVENGSVVLSVPENSANSLVSSVIGATGEYHFAIYNSATGEMGEAVLTREHVKQAYYYNNNNTYQVQVQFNSKGEKAIQALIDSGNSGYLYIVLDGQPIAYAYLTTPANGVMAFSASDWTSAFVTTACMRTNSLPAAVTLSNSGSVEAAAGGLLNAVIIICAIVLAAVCVLVLVFTRTAGLTGVWAVVAWVVLFFLLTALVAVAATWTMTMPAMIVIVLCVCAFLYGLGALYGHMGKQIKNGRGARAAYEAAAKAQLKPLAILYGALVVIGLLLMFIFQAGTYGVLGRIVALSGVVSFVILFVFVRVVYACTATLTGRK